MSPSRYGLESRKTRKRCAARFNSRAVDFAERASLSVATEALAAESTAIEMELTGERSNMSDVVYGFAAFGLNAMCGRWFSAPFSHPSQNHPPYLLRTRGELAAQEIADGGGYLRGVRFERKVARVAEMYFSIGVVTVEGLGTKRQEEPVVAAPDSEDELERSTSEGTLDCKQKRTSSR